MNLDLCSKFRLRSNIDVCVFKSGWTLSIIQENRGSVSGWFTDKQVARNTTMATDSCSYSSKIHRSCFVLFMESIEEWLIVSVCFSSWWVSVHAIIMKNWLTKCEDLLELPVSMMNFEWIRWHIHFSCFEILSFKDLIQYLEKHTNQSIDDIFIAWDIADTVLIEVWNELDLSFNRSDGEPNLF